MITLPADIRKKDHNSIPANYIETCFQKVGSVIYVHHLKMLLFLGMVLSGFIFMLPKLYIDTSSESLLHENHPVRIDYDDFKRQFGREGNIYITIQAPNVFDKHFLDKLASLHETLKQSVPFLKKVTSLINARSIRVDGHDVVIEELYHSLGPKDPTSKTLQSRVMNNPAYIGTIVSEDGTLAVIILDIQSEVLEKGHYQGLPTLFEGDDEAGYLRRLTTNEMNTIVAAVKNVTTSYHESNFRVTVSGDIVVADVCNALTIRDMQVCIVVGLMCILFFLTVFFRTIAGVMLPLIIIAVTMISVFGLMAAAGVSIKLPTIVMPAFLLTVAVGDSIHILSVFYQRLQQGQPKKDAICSALGHSGLPILMTSLTTAAGLLSFSLADLSAISEIGIFAAAGVILALLYTIMLLPAVIAVFPIRTCKLESRVMHFVDRALLWCAGIAINYPKIVIGVSIGMFLLGGGFAFRLSFSHNQLDWFDEHMPAKKDIQYIDARLKGTAALEVIVDTKEKYGVLDVDVLKQIEMFEKRVRNLKNENVPVGTISSINLIVKELNRAAHSNDQKHYTIPEGMPKVPLSDVISTGDRDVLYRFADPQFRQARITVNTPWVDAVSYDNFLEQIRLVASEVFSKVDSITLTGGMALVTQGVTRALENLVSSYIFAFIVIAIMMVWIAGDIRVGVLSMFPNLLPIAVIMGIMGAAGVKLDIVTVMIGSIAIGLVVDDTVHFLYNFQKYYRKEENAMTAIQKTMLGTGRAMLITSLVLSAGFFVLLAATLTNIVRFGLFTGMTILLALFADFLVAAALWPLIPMKKNGHRYLK